MIHEVRIYDAEGNLKDVVEPVFDYSFDSIGGVSMKVCPECKQQAELRGNQKFCGPVCSKKNKSRKEKAKREEKRERDEAKPIVLCIVCGVKPVTGRRLIYCSDICDHRARKTKAMSNDEANKEILRLKRVQMYGEEYRQTIGKEKQPYGKNK